MAALVMACSCLSPLNQKRSYHQRRSDLTPTNLTCTQADDAQQTLYGSLRDLWAALEVRLADALPGVAAVVGQARDAAREARHRQDHLRAALRDTHDALARATAERHRAKQLASDLQVRLVIETAPACASLRRCMGCEEQGPLPEAPHPRHRSACTHEKSRCLL